MRDVALNRTSAAWLEIVRQQVESLQFGVVQIVIHESRVVQIEKTEKIRLNEGAHPSTYKTLPNQTTGGPNKNK